MLAIFKREFRAFFNNVLGWLFVAVNFAFLSLYYFAYNLFQGSADVGYVYSYTVFLFLIIIPVLTMKILSQDRKDKTDQLIFTAPISLFKVIMGKYLALVAVFSIPAAMSAVFPVIISCYGKVDMPKAYTALLGYWLYGIALIAIGMFISSLTENTIIAAVLSVLVFFLLYIMAFFETISSSMPGISKVVTQLDMGKRLSDMTTGELSFSAILYFLSICAIFIFLTISFIRRRRWTFGKNKILKDVGHTTSVILVLAFIVAANWGFSYVPEKYKSIDVNSQKIYELSDQTSDIVNKAGKNILIEVYSTEAQASDDVKKTLRRYDEFENVSVEFIDPKEQTNFANKYGEANLAQGSLVVSCGDKYKVINESSIYKYDEMSYYYTGQQTTTGYDAEGQITSAIAYVTSDKNPIIYNVTGNNESALGQNFSSAIAKENIELKTLDLMKVDQIPDDADAIMILAPETDVNESELQILRDYVEKGGNIYMTYRYTEKSLDNLNSLVADYHLEVKRGVIMESDRNYYYKEADYLIPGILSNGKAGTSAGDTILMVQSVGFSEIKDEAATATDADAASSDVVVFAQTSDNAVLKKNITKATTTGFEEGDEQGSFILGAYSEKGDSKFVIFGTPLVTDDNVDNAVSGNNVKLFGNMMSNLVDHETTVSIPVKSIEPQYVTVPNSNMIVIGLLFIFVIPLVLIVLGIFIWLKRKKK